jgi:hypothetical protein
MVVSGRRKVGATQAFQKHLFWAILTTIRTAQFSRAKVTAGPQGFGPPACAVGFKEARLFLHYRRFS